MKRNLSSASIVGRVLSRYGAVSLERAGNEVVLEYNPYHRLARGIPLLRITEIADDCCELPCEFRLNVCASPEWVEARFAGSPPVDLLEADTVAPHPTDGPRGWVSVLNPSSETFESLEPVIRTTYDAAASRFAELVKRETP
jgi:uncharacterized protein DUF6194